MKHSTILDKPSIDTLAIGCFDGIHMGHQQLIRRLGKQGALFVVDKDQANLTPGAKRALYAGYPCMFYHFLKLKDLSGKEFIALLLKEFPNLKKLVVGYDFCFGRNRAYNAYHLKTFFPGEVEIVEAFMYHGVAVHSSMIRDYLKAGEIKKANRFLGREYSITGNVIKGQGLGSTKLVPTLNLHITDYLLPKEGVYITRSKIGHTFYNSVSFIGKRFSTDGAFSVETHIIGEIAEENREKVELFFVDFLRENRHFETLEALKKQIKEDIAIAKKRLEMCHVYSIDYL